MKSNEITAVLGIYMSEPRQYERTLDFMKEFKSQFPGIPVVLSCVGSLQEYQDKLKALYGDEVVTGTTARVSFSETWDNAINHIKTPGFVLLHNDMYLDPNFFERLGEYLEEPGSFYVYTTVEPLHNAGFPRPGKIVADFGNDVEDFKKQKFLEFSKKYQETHRKAGRGYGFYLAGFTENMMQVGGFDYTTFNPIFCEDDDLLVRIRKQGFKLCTAPAAIVYHFGSKTTREIGATGMTDSEIEMNRRFAQKWGFEARYLWETGYEFYDEPLETGTETIGISFPSGTDISALNALNLEPLIDKLDIDTPEIREVFRNMGVEHKLGSTGDCDIEIYWEGTKSFNTVAYLLGGLRFKYKQLTPGTTIQLEGFTIVVRNVYKDRNRVDPNNYLSSQRESNG